MHGKAAILEIMRWGSSNVPGALFYYGQELDLNMEDIGVLAAIFYTLERTKPLFQTGVSAGQVLQLCPIMTKQKLSRRISRLKKLEIISVEDKPGGFASKNISLEPLFQKLEALIGRDHIEISHTHKDYQPKDEHTEQILEEYRNRIEQLELELEEEKKRQLPDMLACSDSNFKTVADFISEKTGNLMSVKMATELKRWLNDMAFTPQFLLMMLELCFERKIHNPRDITSIARDLKEYSINTVEGLNMYFSKCVDADKIFSMRRKKFDPDIAEFGSFTGIDMNAEARKNVYYKWRYDWGFTHTMIMKAGQIMCQRTKNGGLEYVDSVLYNWMSKEIRSPEDAEQEIKDFKARKQSEKNSSGGKKSHKRSENEYEIYVAPSSIEELKSNL